MQDSVILQNVKQKVRLPEATSEPEGPIREQYRRRGYQKIELGHVGLQEYWVTEKYMCWTELSSRQIPLRNKKLRVFIPREDVAYGIKVLIYQSKPSYSCSYRLERE